MTIRTGLFTGLNVGLKTSLLTKYGGVNLLASLDFSAPATQSFPTTAAGLASLLGDASATPSYIWDCQETSGTTITDSIASEVLTPPFGTPLIGQTAVGMDDGSGYIGRKAVEGISTSTSFDSATTATMDSDSTSVAFVCVFRCRDDATVYPIYKRSGAPGYYFRILAGSGNVWLLANDDTSNQQIAQVVGAHNDGAWHVAVVGYHATDNESHAHTDLGSATDNAPAHAGSMANAGKFQIIDDSPGCQVAYVAAFEGAAAEALLDLGATAVTNFWTHATDPTGLLTTATRASLISTPVAAGGYVGHFATNTLAIGYNSNFTDTNKLGLYCNSAVTNLITESEDVSTWTGTAARVANAADSPDGFRSAGSLTATGGTWRTGATAAVTVTAATDYTFSCWVKRNQGTDAAGALRLYDVTAVGYVQSAAFTATDTWQRVSVTGQLPVNTSLQNIVRVDTEDDSILVWGAQCEIGTVATHYIRTNGASASLVASNYQAGSTGFPVNLAVGEIKTTFAQLSYSVPNAGLYNIVGTGNQNRKRVFISATNWAVEQYHGAGASETLQYAAHGSIYTENVIRHVWDQSAAGDATGGYEQVFVLNGTTYLGNASPWEDLTVGDPLTTISVGSIAGAFNNDTVIQAISSYDGLNGDLP